MVIVEPRPKPCSEHSKILKPKELLYHAMREVLEGVRSVLEAVKDVRRVVKVLEAMKVVCYVTGLCSLRARG